MPDKAPKPLTKTQQKVSAICDKALEEMQQKVLAHYQAHPDSAWSGHHLVDLEKTVKEVYRSMGLSIGDAFRDGLNDQMRAMYDKAYEDVKKAGRRNAILGKPNVRLVKDYLKSSFEEIAMRTTQMSFDHVRALRSMAADVLRTASLTGASRAEVTKQFLARAEEIPGFKFTAANGRQWSNKAYFNMLARTELMNAGRAAYDQKCADEGCDLVQLDVSGNCCEACARWEGQIFSLTGATKGYPTKADLEADGVFHPNCTHRYTAVADWDAVRRAAEEARKEDEEEKNAKGQQQGGEVEQAAPAASFPDNIDNLKVVKHLGGSTGADLVEDASGNKYVMKRGGGAGGEKEAHLRNEFAADNAYRALGIKVPEGKIIETPRGPVKLTRYIEGEDLGVWWDKATPSEREKMKEKLRKDFAADVVLGNRDLIGMSRDNIKVDANGDPWRIDNGAAMGFRAQGARKDDWSAGGGADVVTMRTSKDHKEFFGDMDLLSLMKDIESRDWKVMLDSLPDADRKVIEKRIEEIKAAIPRTEDFKKNSGYTPQSIDEVIRASMEFSADGLRERIPTTVDHESRDYGWFRSSLGSGHGSKQKTLAESNDNKIHNTIVEAAKTINFHNGAKNSKSGSGDHSPNQSKIDSALALKAELEKLAANGNDGAKYYLRQLEKIEKAAKDGTTLSGSNVSADVPVYTAEKQPQQKQKPVDKNAPKSFTQQVYDKIASESIEYNGKKIKLDPYFIAQSQKSQAGNSFNKDACKLKMVRLNAMGIDPDKASADYFTGYTTTQKRHWSEAKNYYKNHPDELARDTATYLRYQSAVQIALEQCNLPGNDPATHTIILARTEDDKVMAKSKVGHEMQAKHGVNESHSVFKTVVVDGDNLTMTRVPYSRISGIFMAEQNPGKGDTGFLGDSENEFTADTSGLKTMFVEANTHRGKDLKPYREKYIKWEKAGYP